MKAEKVFRILFKISFIPYIALIVIAIYKAFFGFTFIFHTYYGIEAFFNTIWILGMIGCICPIFPIVFIYQITYIKRKKKKGKDDINEHT